MIAFACCVGIAEHPQRLRHRLVDDLEVAAAGELLELDEGEVRLDAGGVAIHDEADGAGRRHDGRLGVPIAVLLAEFERAVPGAAGMLDQVLVRARGVVERHRRDGELLVAAGVAVGGAAMVAHHPQHVAAVVGVAVERPLFLRHFRRSRVGNAGHDRRDGAAQRAAGGRVIGEPLRHQQAADVGKAEPERAVAIGQLGDLPRRELRHHHRDFEDDGPQPDGVFEGVDVERQRQ